MSEVSLTSPLGLKKYLRPRSDCLDPVPFIDVLLLGLFFALFNSRFLLPPGIPIDLPQAGDSSLVSRPVTAVVTVLPPRSAEQPNGGVVLFGGDVISQNELELSLSEYLRTHPSEAPVLLVKMDARASLSQLVDISRAAKASGFASLQLAAERLGPEGDDFGQ